MTNNNIKAKAKGCKALVLPRDSNSANQFQLRKKFTLLEEGLLLLKTLSQVSSRQTTESIVNKTYDLLQEMKEREKIQVKKHNFAYQICLMYSITIV